MGKRSRFFDGKVDELHLSTDLKKKRKQFMSLLVEPLDLKKVKSITSLIEGWEKTSIQSRSIALAAKTYENMLADKARPTIFLGLSGALIAGGLREVIRDLIDFGLVDVIVSTGAILYQDYYTSKGYRHYRGSSTAPDDELLHDVYLDRIYDSYVDEVGFVRVDDMIAELAEALEPRKYSTREFMMILGEDTNDPKSILYTAAKKGVPIFCPAIADSSIGIGLTGLYRWCKKQGKACLTLDTIRDNYEIAQIVLKSKKTAAIYVGGGVPKNYINDACVMLDYTKGHSYAIQITTDSPHWGGLTGSTLDEAKSWGKISKKATRATAYVEATIGLSLISAYVMQKNLGQGRKHLKLKWHHDELKSLQLI